MSSNRPPQIHLSLHAENGTSFKRSFEQYGFDLDTPLTDASVAGGSGLSGVGSADANDRNKRARSESSLSNTDELAGSSGSSEVGPAGSSGATSIEDDSMSPLSATRSNSLADNVSRISPPVLTELSRLSSPDFEDVEMSAIGDGEPLSPPPVHSTSVSGHEESYRASLERFSVFDNAISALRQSTSAPPVSSPTLPPLSTVADDNDEAHPRVPSHAFRNLEFVEEDSNIPGLQVFTLGELHSSESDGDSREGTMPFQPDLDEGLGGNLSLPSQNSSRPPGRFSTLAPHAHTTETPNVAREQMPALPRLSPTPFFSQQYFEWWPSELSSGDPSTSRPRADAPSRGATDYMPPRDWFDAPLSSRDRQTGTPANASWSRRRGISRARPRHMELVDDVSDDDRPVFFPSVAQLAQDRYDQERPFVARHPNFVDVQRPPDASSRLNGERHPRQSEFDADLRLNLSHIDRLPFSRTEAPARSRMSPMQRPHESLEDVRSRSFGRRSTLPGIEISDVESDVRPRHLDRINSGPSLQRSSNSTGNLASFNHPQRSPADRIATISAFLRRPIASGHGHGPSSSTNASRLSPPTSNVDDAELSGTDWSMPLYPINDLSRQPPPAAQERFQSRSYSSRLASSNSLVSENAAELRRNLARSQMLQTLPQDDGISDDISNLRGADSPWRTRHEPETDPWSQPVNRTAMLRDAPSRPRPRAGSLAGELWRDRTSNPSLRPYASSLSTSRTVGRADEGGHRFNPLLGPPSTPPSIRSTAPVSSASNLTSRINRDRTLLGMADPSQAVALSATSPTSPVFGSSFNSRQISQRTHGFGSTVDTSRGISTGRPVRAQSPVAWDDLFDSAAYPQPRADSAVPGHMDHDMRISARQRPPLVDVGPFRSLSPASPVERAPRSPDPPSATPVSTYGSLDLSAYHEGPFRASLQRYVDFDRIRSRLSRLESMADNVSSRSASQSTLPPSLPPLQFDDDDDDGHVSAGNISSRATLSARRVRTFPVSLQRFTQYSRSQPTSLSPTNNRDINFPHMVREARLGRSTVPTQASLQTAQDYSPDLRENSSLEIDIRTERDRWASWGVHMDSNNAVDHPSSEYAWEDENRLQQERFSAYDARLQPFRSNMVSNSPVDPPPNTRAISPALPRFAEGDDDAQDGRTIGERANNRINSIHTRVRAIMDARAQARANAQRTENVGADGFGEAMDILRGDGLSNSTQRQFFDRYQRARDTADTDGFSAAENDLSEGGSRFWPARTRYARRARVYRPVHPGESATAAHHGSLNSSTRQHRASSHSPTRNGGSSERLAATAAILADRAARLRATRERVYRDREFMLGDFQRFDLIHSARPGRNMGDYIRDEDFDSSYENLLSLASTLGEARPKATPNHVIAALPTGFYKDWQTADSDQRCPICLDDYKSLDPVLKLPECSHWLHKGCLEQWLHGASTCPVCRKRVKASRCPRYQHGLDQGLTPSGSGQRERGDDDATHGSVPQNFESETPPWRLWE